MNRIKRLICVLLLPVLLLGCSSQKTISYQEAEGKYQAFIDHLHSENTITDQEYYDACVDLFQSIAHGSAAEQAQFTQLTRELIAEITNFPVAFADAEVYEIAQGYAVAFSRYAAGDRDDGVQKLEVKRTSRRTAQLDFSYWGEMWYSVKMVEVGDQWVTGEFTGPYQGEIGQYLLLVQFHDAEPSTKFMEQYPGLTDHKLRIPRFGSDRELNMHIIGNADHGYDVYIGSDEPFWVEEQSSVRLNRMEGTVSVELHFGETSDGNL